MTSSYQHSHNPNNHLSRRASVATAPYTIPSRHNSVSHSHSPLSPPSSSNIHIPAHQQHPHHHHHHHHHHHANSQTNHQQLSSSVPVLSREFVVRRISEGESGRLKEELKCEACGKGYKHISSLAKHLWEHTPEWNVTKKLLISKHQQVQLLEAASILVSMNEVSPSPLTEQVIKEDEEIKFNPKYTEHNSDDDEDDEDDEDEDGDRSSNSPSPYLKELKNRNGSISQIPPSGLNGTNSPAKVISTGGFLDVPRGGQQQNGKKNGSISYEAKSNKENLENAIVEDEQEAVFGMD